MCDCLFTKPEAGAYMHHNVSMINHYVRLLMAENVVMHSKLNQYCSDQYRTRDGGNEE